MMYYRVAWKSNQSTVWQWKSTKLTSLEALFGFLRMYSAIPQDQLRVFSSSSLESLNEMLTRENKGWESASITAEEFLRERRMQVPERGAIAVTTRPVVDESSTVEQSLSKWNGSVLERRRAEFESGAGGDHDLPYTFGLPLSMPQTLAWTRLLVKVQRGELEL
ncbi:MAG TPA: hypothetical protein VIY29_13370 [Ktedonobacteraceae bacterium]